MWTRPLRRLTPRTSYGYAVIHFAATVLQRPLDPWQQWLVIHLGELLDDGRPRFRKALVIVARQNGKTHLCTVLALFWLYVERWPLVFGTSNKIEYAADAWKDAVDLALSVPALAAQTNKPRFTNGQNNLPTRHRSSYRIGAANADGGRSKSIDRAIGDELRQQKDWTAYAALIPAMNARPRAQVIYITNMGDSTSVVLNELRAEAEAAIAAGDVERPTALFEWSAPAGSHPTDVHALAAANPQAGRRMDWDMLTADAAAVARPGADPKKLASFLTEIMCIPVDQMDPAIDPGAWAAGRDRAPIPAGVPVTACLDISPDQQHATLAVAAALPDGRIRLEVVKDWAGPTALADLRREFRSWVATVRPVLIGWFPNGPAASIDAELRDRRRQGRYMWPPRGTRIDEIRQDQAAVCMGLAEQVAAGEIVHSGQELLDDHIGATDKAWRGGRWVFARRGSGHIDAAYAAAGAVHLARVAPKRRRATPHVHGVVV